MVEEMNHQYTEIYWDLIESVCVFMWQEHLVPGLLSHESTFFVCTSSLIKYGNKYTKTKHVCMIFSQQQNT